MLYTVERQDNLTQGVYSLWCRCEETLRRPRPGQFVHAACGERLLLRRPISICDVDGNRLRLVFDTVGEGTRWLSRRQPGDTLDLLAPLGHGYSFSSPEKILLVGGGLGVPPMVYCARQAGGSADAVVGFRDSSRVILTEEMRAFCGSVTLMTDDGSAGEKGFVDAAVRRLLTEGHYQKVLACGPKVMLRAVAGAAAEAGVPCQVSMEERMACGIGACRVCACKVKEEEDVHTYKRACVDGPVFNAAEVDFS